MATATSPEFQKAVEDSRKLNAKPSNDELLEVSSSRFITMGIYTIRVSFERTISVLMKGCA